MLGKFMGEANTQGLYQLLYDKTIETIRPIGRNFFAPPLEVYEDFMQEDGVGIVPKPQEDKVVYIDKPGSPTGDNITFEMCIADKATITGTINIGLSSPEDFEEAFRDTCTVLKYGVSKLQKDLRKNTSEIFVDSLLNEKYDIHIARVRISSKASETMNIPELLVIYELTITNEPSLRPPEPENSNKGGSEYKRVELETNVGKK